MFAQGHCFMYDVTLPYANFYDIVLALRRRLANEPGLKDDDVSKAVTGFGHLGDANVHVNVMCTKYTDRLATAIEQCLYDYVRSAGGSVSAEHGMGLLKRNYMSYSRDAAAIEEMRALKGMMDPRGILNPYKVLPEVSAAA